MRIPCFLPVDVVDGAVEGVWLPDIVQPALRHRVWSKENVTRVPDYEWEGNKEPEEGDAVRGVRPFPCGARARAAREGFGGGEVGWGKVGGMVSRGNHVGSYCRVGLIGGDTCDCLQWILAIAALNETLTNDNDVRCDAMQG